MAVAFVLNGRPVNAGTPGASVTLLQWLRARGLTGTKEGCAEGECGACAVAMRRTDAQGRTRFESINSCLVPLAAVHDETVVTVEGIAPGEGLLHPVQDAMVRAGGSQCGYCTPGFVVSLFCEYYRPGRDGFDAESISGNLCRCTGYRPIADVVRTLPAPASNDPRLTELAAPESPRTRIDSGHGLERFVRPTSLDDLFRCLAEAPTATLIAGGTDVMVGVTQKGDRHPVVVSLAALPELRTFAVTPDAIVLGAGLTLTDVDGAPARAPEAAIPLLGQLLPLFSSRLIRNRATLGGNLMTASPIGDAPPVLLALDASVTLASTAGRRVVPLREFFLAYRKTAARPDEVMIDVRVPRGAPAIQRFYKVSKRILDDISTVAAAFALDLTPDGRGGTAPGRLRRNRGDADSRLGARGRRGPPAVDARDDRRAAADCGDARHAAVGSARQRRAIAAPWSGGCSRSSLPRRRRVETAPEKVARRCARLRRSWAAALPHESRRRTRHRRGPLRRRPVARRRARRSTRWPVQAPHAHARVLRDRRRRRAPGAGRRSPCSPPQDVPGENDIGPVAARRAAASRPRCAFTARPVAWVVAETEEQARVARAAACRSSTSRCRRSCSIEQAHRRRTASSPSRERLARGDAEAALRDGAAPRSRARSRSAGRSTSTSRPRPRCAHARRGRRACSSHSSTQHPDRDAGRSSRACSACRSTRVVVQCLRMGGAFGGKEVQANAWAAIAALGRVEDRAGPVRVRLDAPAGHGAHRQAPPVPRALRRRLRRRRPAAGARASSCSATAAGRSICSEPVLVPRACSTSTTPTTCRTCDVDRARLPHAPRLAHRVPRLRRAAGDARDRGDRRSRRARARPAAGRRARAQLLRARATRTHYGQAVRDAERIARIWTELQARARFEARWREVAAFNAAHAHVKRGLAITPVKFGISFTTTCLNQAGALVLVYRDGSVQVNHGGTEMGQGLHTKIAQVAADARSACRSTRVRVMPTRTDKVPNTSATAASSGSDLNGAAVQHACDTLRDRLAPSRPSDARRAAARGVALRRRPGARRGRPATRSPFARSSSAAYMERVQLFGHRLLPHARHRLRPRRPGRASRSTTSRTARR